jgi:hypothetical protein
MFFPAEARCRSALWHSSFDSVFGKAVFGKRAFGISCFSFRSTFVDFEEENGVLFSAFAFLHSHILILLLGLGFIFLYWAFYVFLSFKSFASLPPVLLSLEYNE